MTLVLTLGVGALWVALAQVPPESTTQKPVEETVLQNTGRPMHIPFQCKDEDVQWAGMTCSVDEPCSVYLEISEVESVGNRIIAVGNIHTTSTTLYSILLSSDDAGKTWQEAFERIRGAGLYHIQFVDFETGWISGQSLVPFPQDPFLLLTTDGGKTWRRQPIFSTENRPGAIVQFWFTSRTQGGVLLEDAGDESRYELWESPNGGETWMVKEVSDNPIRTPKASSSPTAWRVRADGVCKCFLLERRQGERWSTVASFLIPIGVCKPAETVETPPPPENQPVPEPESPPKRPSKPPSLRRPPR